MRVISVISTKGGVGFRVLFNLDTPPLSNDYVLRYQAPCGIGELPSAVVRKIECSPALELHPKWHKQFTFLTGKTMGKLAHV